MLSCEEGVFGNRLAQSAAMWLTGSRHRTSILQDLQNSHQPPIWLLIVAGMALGVIVIVLVLAIPVSGEDFRYYTGYGFNGPFVGGGGSGCLEWWRKKKYHPPLVLTPQELKDTADVFSIEFVDMKQRHRVLYGEDVLRNLDVPVHLHRSQLEYELREKLFLLRQHILVAGTRE